MPLEISEGSGVITIDNDLLQLVVSTERARIESWKWKGHDLLVAGPQLQIWRGATDNDGIKGYNHPWFPLFKWRQQGLDRLVLQTVFARATARQDGSVVLVLEQIGSCAASKKAVRHRHAYTILPTGEILVRNEFFIDPAIPDLPRLGVVMSLPAGLEKLNWFGRGPFENYWDRKRAAHVDLYESTVAGQYVPYIVPQEHGNHTDVRWLSLQGAKAGILVQAEELLEFTASHFSAHDLYAARHTYDLEPRPEIILSLDLHQRGLGTASCGPDTLDRYKIGPGKHLLRYRLFPFAKAGPPGNGARS